MATLKDIEIKIGAVKKTKQITKAMNMVAASKLRGAQRDMDGFRPYVEKFNEVLGRLAEKSSEESSPLLLPKEKVKKINIVLFTSDRGLCGGFNSNLINRAITFINEKGEDNIEFSFTNFGKKGRDWCRNKKKIMDDEYIGVVASKFDFPIASIAGSKIINAFIEDNKYDEVYIIYSKFVNIAKQEPVLKQLLPIPPLEMKEEVVDESKPFLAEHICEPSVDAILGDMLPKSIFVQIYSALLETSTSEHGARMSAMDNATKACSDMVDNLTLTYNKVRQAAITADLMDIVGGAEALKG
mmetsp:Transcript_21553/g.10019  ORF Transcript_21553/g.10019 Transcript_21553/m.10019 type:complete len:298 (+) Transcript_21553:780-1673(+)